MQEGLPGQVQKEKLKSAVMTWAQGRYFIMTTCVLWCYLVTLERLFQSSAFVGLIAGRYRSGFSGFTR